MPAPTTTTQTPDRTDAELAAARREAERAAAEAREAVATALRTVVTGDVDTSTRRRAEYSTDASNYRVVPDVVVFPRSTDEVVRALDVLRELKVPVTARGAGTSVAGNSVGTGVVLDFSKHLGAVLEVDPDAGTAVVEPGTIMSTLQKAAAPHGLRFGPDPSTQNRATLGGMIGNNACGPHAVAYGRTADNVVELDVVDGRGRRFTAGAGDPTFAAVPGLAELVRENLALIRTEFGRFGRQVSGYSLEHLLPENGSDLAKALVGTEGTLVTVLGATLRLVPTPSAPTLVVLGYPDMPAAADDVPALLSHDPLAIEGLDARLVDVVRRANGDASVPPLPYGAGWLMIEVGGATQEQALERAELIVEMSSAISSEILPAGPAATAMWQIRADGAGLAGRTPAGEQAWPGWEDSAVPPERLGDYLRDLEALMGRYGVDGLPYGHFGDGCVHLRIDLPLETSGSVLRTFMLEAAELVAKYGGSLSGEHGDGRARSELLPLMYSPEAIALMEKFKALFDPEDVLNPGVVVRPRGVDDDLRRPAAQAVPSRSGVGARGLAGPTPLRGIAKKAGYAGFSFAHDHHDMTTAVHRCVGVGKCRADTSGSGGFMCPSYRATKDEKDVTRGRARVLQEAVNGTLVGGLTAPEVHESLDLCLSCKACSSDCPAGVDMAQYKSEVLYRTYKGKLRPVDHYALGWLPRWARLAGTMPRFLNRVLRVRPIAKAVLWAGGMDTRRQVPEFAEVPFRTWWRRGAATHGVPGLALGQEPGRPVSPGGRPRVVLWTDSFSDTLSPSVPQAAVRVLTAAGYDVVVPDKQACCGLTWISTGQLDGARKRLSSLLSVLGPYAVNGIPILGLEPSCTAVLRSDLLDLFPDDPRAHAVAGATRTLAELLTSPDTAPSADSGWSMPDLSDLTAVVQPHCHQHSVMGFAADEALLRSAGATIRVLAGCCGLAGNFGMQRGHYDVSVAVAENALLPALRSRGDGEAFVADGFSCRTQALQLEGVEGKALVEILAERLPTAK
ncbi:FAD-binding and (Fe-S)-binding domain-containing protein [Isoptericola variabilis]|uniref:D-lactate dehydrogenase (Cytochrome) n=1 Tax=Isoptericola variabilis (strain 225) TaxID=743718 RepID=F6FU06_ISOV2|nr:D-lactate dehydrogenase (cytochrome) [Isoptericola variabilis 225]